MDEQELFCLDVDYNIRYSKDAREILELLYYTPKPMLEHIKAVLRRYKKSYEEGVKELQ